MTIKVTKISLTDIIPSDGNGRFDSFRALNIRAKDRQRVMFYEHWARLADRIFDHTTKNLPKKVLDLGCGSGRYFNFIHCDELYGLDGSMDMLNLAKGHWGDAHYTHLHLIQDDFVEFVKRSEFYGTFDYIISVLTLGMPSYSFDSLDIIQSLPALLSPGGVMDLHIQEQHYSQEEVSRAMNQLKNNGVIEGYTIEPWSAPEKMFILNARSAKKGDSNER